MTQLLAVIAVAVGLMVVVGLSTVVLNALLHLHTVLWLRQSYGRKLDIPMQTLLTEAFVPKSVQSGMTPVGIIFFIVALPVLFPLMCFALIGKSLSNQLGTGKDERKKQTKKRVAWLMDREKAITESLTRDSDSDGSLQALRQCWRANCIAERVLTVQREGRQIQQTHLDTARADVQEGRAVAAGPASAAHLISQLTKQAEATLAQIPDKATVVDAPEIPDEGQK